MSLFKPTKIFGPGDSRLLNFLNKTIRSERIYTDASDYTDRKIQLQSAPVMELALKNAPIRKRNGGEKLRILYMSHASEFKGFHDIVRLCSILKNEKIHLRVCFSKPVDEYVIEFLKRELASSVYLEIMGIVDYKEQLMWADIYYYVYWNERWTYIVPLSLLEAIMMGCVPLGPQHESVIKWIDADFLVDPNQLDQSLVFLKNFRAKKMIYAEKILNNRKFLIENCEWIKTKRTLND